MSQPNVPPRQWGFEPEDESLADIEREVCLECFTEVSVTGRCLCEVDPA